MKLSQSPLLLALITGLGLIGGGLLPGPAYAQEGIEGVENQSIQNSEGRMEEARLKQGSDKRSRYDVGANRIPPEIPMKDFFRNPKRSSYKLSPDGQRLAYMKSYKDRMNVYVRALGAPDSEAVRVTTVTERDISAYFWKGNDRIIYLRDKGGNENFHLYAVQLTKALKPGQTRELTPYEGVRVGVADDLEEHPTDMLVTMNKRNPRLFDLYRLNTQTGDTTRLITNNANYQRYITDHEGRVRMVVKTDGVNQTLLHRSDASEAFQPVLRTNFRQTVAPLFFTADNQQFYALSNLERDKQALVRFDPITGQETEVLLRNDTYDMGGAVWSDRQDTIVAAYWTADKRRYQIFTDKRQRIMARLKAELGDREVVISNKDDAEDDFIVRTYSDLTRGAYYHYDYQTDELRKLGAVAPWLAPGQMAPMKPISYKARDGLTIHGYLTLPRGRPPRDLPVVVKVHGGPWARVSWGFDPETQFLANRGYAVLQVNFRGSTGYGRDFWTAGFGEWGKKMQNDITDGVQWLIRKGIADPEHVGIYGGSYGGYATLAGVTFTPDLYACGVDYVGVSNLFTFMETIPPYWKPMLDMMHEMVGDPKADSAQFRATSPVFHADKIQCPLFIAQGANDPRVNKAEADQIVEALKANNVPHRYMVKEDEGHGFRKQENRFDFYAAMEEFLAKHLQPAAPAQSAQQEDGGAR
jgi:dipeptidyl aminopeptidase/acylaminoacyl peptidase